jgi:hypothetical protein
MLTPVEEIGNITPDWMTEALSLRGAVHNLWFAAVGTGQMADSFRVSLEGDGDLPTSVIVKMQAADELAREAGAGSAYRSEVGFYAELANTVSIRTPKCYCVVGPDEDARFTLVLEDLAPAQQGDQILGCTLNHARAAVVNLAGLHGPRWCDPALLKVPWLRRVSPTEAEFFRLTLMERTEIFIGHYRDRLTTEDIEVLQEFAPRCGLWLMDRADRFSLVHGDYRPDNLLFGDKGADVPIATVDWQTLEVGNSGRDLAYFLGNSLLVEDRRQYEQELVNVYHNALMSFGVEGYSLEACFDDYRFGHFQGPLITVLAAASLTHTERGDDMFIAMCTRACQAIRDLESFELLQA